MDKPIKKNKGKKIVLIAISIFLVAIIFKYFVLTGENRKDGIKKYVAPVEFEGRTAEEIMKDLSAPRKTGEALAPVSTEVMDSLTAPAKASSVSASEMKNKAAQPVPVSISKDVIMSLTAPTK